MANQDVLVSQNELSWMLTTFLGSSILKSAPHPALVNASLPIVTAPSSFSRLIELRSVQDMNAVFPIVLTVCGRSTV